MTLIREMFCQPRVMCCMWLAFVSIFSLACWPEADVSAPPKATRDKKQVTPIVNGARTAEVGNTNTISPLVSPVTRGAKDIPTLARLWPAEEAKSHVSISGLCHILLFYGLGPTDLQSFPTGRHALNALTDEATAIQVLGKSPFIQTRNGLRYIEVDGPLNETEFGESHRDLVLATFAAMDLSLTTPITLKDVDYTVSDLLSESIANFYIKQNEIAWTALAYATYLPPKTEWANRYRERTSFSQLANHLMATDLTRESCGGIHIVQALARLFNVHHRVPIIDKTTLKHLEPYLKSKVSQATKLQEPRGAWNVNWCDSYSRNQEVTLRERVLITGHLLEFFSELRPNLRPPSGTLQHAINWLKNRLESGRIVNEENIASWVCPFTHGARFLQQPVKKMLLDSTH